MPNRQLFRAFSESGGWLKNISCAKAMGEQQQGSGAPISESVRQKFAGYRPGVPIP
jgi:hypothetical protein